ncbi:hypothetical protein PMAYCL1PPCAC_24757 [Pristionchus mayeri]|uniref:Protein kinase domain-containing protein n=1 Tax=Pristionchus mayeri TaxID=1317129 RepID=A0AAN5D2J8_9BILA|nr:hypothetical protein PMAYCL1PPCAC_24757 [Pristionchus mayeri]
MPSEPPPEVKIAIGDKIADGKFVVKKKLGEGSCGQVYLVHDKADNLLAMKVEPKMKNREEEILKMEIYVLKKLQNSKYVCRFYSSGVQSNYSYVVMSLLGQELSELRRRCPGRRMCHSSVLRIAIQAVAGVEDMHTAGFIHRDLKPTNLAIGNKLKHAVFLFDFGLARQIMVMGKDGKMALREPRKKVSFRGTVRYCSLNVHLGKEQGRHDDLWSILFSMIELATGNLPWKGSMRKDAEKIKTNVTEKQLFRGVPRSMLFMHKQLAPLQYADTPNYAHIKGAIAKKIKAKKVSMTDPYEWEKGAATGGSKEKEKETNKDVGAEVDKGADNDTNKDVDENAQSATSELSNNESINDCDIENTLENVADVKESFRETRDDKT